MNLKKFNWGHGITIFYIIFVGIVVTVLIASFSVDHSLVTENYYAKDIAYQTQYNKEKNFLSKNKEDISVDVLSEKQLIELHIKSAYSIKGTIHFYRPSERSKDFSVTISGEKTSISTKPLAKGKWVLKIEWQEGSRSFYYEHEIYLN